MSVAVTALTRKTDAPLPPAASTTVTRTIRLPFNVNAKKPTHEVHTITPEMAQYILSELNPHNRKLRSGVAERYGKAMREGKWQVTNSGLGFCTKGFLIDGQHRLWGCVDADVPFDTIVTVGLDEEAAEVIDTGLRRTEVDVLKIRTGETVRPTVIATARLMMSLKNYKNIDRQDLLDFTQRHESAIAFAHDVIPNTRHISIAHVLAVIGRAFYSVDHEKIAKFGRVLTTGLPEHGDGNFPPVIMLRNYLLKMTSRSDEDKQAIYWKTENALMAYLKDRKITRLDPASDEQFPIGGKRVA